MDRTFLCRLASMQRWANTLALFAALFLLPSTAWASDPVEMLKDALKIDPGVIDPNERLLTQRREMIEKAMPELKSISQLRRAYFLKEWVPHAKLEKVDPKLDIEAYRRTIGKNLAAAVRKAAGEPNLDRQIAVAIMIAEMAESDQPTERSANGKYASRFTDLLVAGKQGKSLAEHENLMIRQAALSALGKITPKPADAKPALRSALAGQELGPRRLAAYALLELVKNAHFRERGDEMETIAEAVNAAVFGLRNPDEDELVRAYCLQTIRAAAKVFTDYAWPTDTAIRFDMEGGKLVLDANVRKILQSLQEATRPITETLKSDPKFLDLRLTALDALSQIVNARFRIISRLTEDQKEVPPQKRPSRGDLFKSINAPDPIGTLLDGDWEVVPGLLKKGEDFRLRRGAILLLEMVAEDIEQTLATRKVAKNDPSLQRRFVNLVTPALYDPDRMVRWSAARTIRHVAFEHIDEAIIVALGHMLVDPVDRDADLSATAAATLEDVASSPYAPKAVRFLKSAITDRERDVEIRLAALKALAAIGNADNDTAKKTANGAFPEVASVLSESDLRMRRAGAETLGRLGAPPTRAMAEEAIAALRNCLRDDDAQVRHNASEAILSIAVPR